MTTKTTPQMALTRFEQLLGTHETPPGSNHVPGITDFLHTANGSGTGNSPWCAETVSRVLSDIGQHDFYGKQFVNGIAYVPLITALAHATGRFIAKANGMPGDVGIFVWGGAGSNPEGDHAGMCVYKNSNGTFRTIEGNATEGTSIGDEVGYHDRAQSDILGWYRPAWGITPVAAPVRPTPPPVPAATPPYPGYTLHLSTPYITGTAVKEWQTEMTKKGYRLTVDGVYGPSCASACGAFQKAQKLTVDDIVGPATWAASFK